MDGDISKTYEKVVNSRIRPQGNLSISTSAVKRPNFLITYVFKHLINGVSEKILLKLLASLCAQRNFIIFVSIYSFLALKYNTTMPVGYK